MSVAADALIGAALRLGESAARTDFRGADPYDGLFWPWPRPLVGGRRRRQAIIQLHARLPLDVRRLYRRQHALIPKALGVYGSVGVRASRLAGAVQPPPFALRALELLVADRAAGPAAWGYHWDVQTRWSFYAAGSPNVVATTFAAAGLLEAAAATSRSELMARARAAAGWVLEELWVEPEGYFAYHSGQPINIHNASLLGAWLVHVALGGDPTAADRVSRAVERTLAAQRPDGSWAYGEAPHLAWADSFHTGYVLSCLERMRGVDPRVGEAVGRGAGHYRRYFDDQGRARLWAHKPFPEDGHSAGTGLTTLALLQRRELVEPDILERVAARVLRSGLRAGHAVHRRYRRGRSTVRYLRWCDAHVALGLVDAAAAMAGEPDLAAPVPASLPAARP